MAMAAAHQHGKAGGVSAKAISINENVIIENGINGISEIIGNNGIGISVGKRNARKCIEAASMAASAKMARAGSAARNSVWRVRR